MFDFTAVTENLKERGYEVKVFSKLQEASDYLEGELNDVTVGIGGSATVQAAGLYERLSKNNTVIWHWMAEDMDEARQKAMTTDVYLTSANALAETGEIVNIDGRGNRISSTLFGHKKVYFLIGRNKITKTYEDAVWRARNVAAPKRAKQLNAKTPCAVDGKRCYDCKSPGRVCRGMVTLWMPILQMEMEVLLIDEDLGL